MKTLWPDVKHFLLRLWLLGVAKQASTVTHRSQAHIRTAGMAMAYAAKPSYSDLLVSVFGLVSVVLLLAQPGTSLMKHEPAITCRLGGEDDDGKTCCLL